jgi:diguanylate cyclase (GGDEF)-like protein
MLRTRQENKAAALSPPTGAAQTDSDRDESGCLQDAPSGNEPSKRKRFLNRALRRLDTALGRYSFALRIVLALTFSMALLVVASQIFFTHAISQQLIDQGSRYYGADGVALEKAYREGSGPADAMDDTLDLVDSLRDRPDVVSATLFDSAMREVVAPRDSNLRGRLDPNPKFNAALSKGRSFSGVETEGEEGGSRFEFIVPVKLDGRRYVLEVNQDASALNTQVAALRNETVIFSTIALIVAMVLFYFVAGRALVRRHGKARKGASRDPLTDLGNHSVFQEELARAVAFAARRSEPVALALVDLDDFKLVNDRFGHRRGDEVLAEVAVVLESGRVEDRAFRIGGDEFALLMPGSDYRRARIALERLLAKATSSRNPMSLTAGIAVITPGVEGDPAALWEQADAALYEGKRTGGGRVTEFDEVAERLSVITPDKVHSLRSLLAEPRLEVAFQPIWKLRDNEILGFEALARPWPGYGFEGPAEAFAVAEKIGRAGDLDALCRAAALARVDELPEDVLLFLNLNPQSLIHGTVDGDRLLRTVEGVGLDPKRVVLEISERSPARLDHVIASAKGLRQLGFRLALDDVGTGNSGLEMLRDLPVDFVKIDQSVVAPAVDDPKAQALLMAIIAFAQRADAFVIAEGIESEQILSFVRHAHEMEVMNDRVIDGGQGFALGRPDPNLISAPSEAPPISDISVSRSAARAEEPL